MKGQLDKWDVTLNAASSGELCNKCETHK